MLEYKLKANDRQIEPERLDVTSMTLSGESEDFIYVCCENSDGHQLVTGDIVTFKREEGYIETSADREATVIDKYTFCVDKLPPYELFIDTMDKGGYDIRPTSGGTPEHVNGVILYFSEPHFFVENKMFSYITEAVGDDYYTRDGEEVRLCVGDNLLYNGFVYHVNAEGDIINGKYNFSGKTYLNNSSVNLFFYTPDGNRYNLNNCIVPITEDALEDRYKLFVPGDNNTAAITQLSSYGPITLEFYTKDYRFYIKGDRNTLELRKDINGIDTSFITTNTENHKLTIPIFTNREENINREDAFGNVLIPEIEKSVINSIVDYERYSFQPVYYSGGTTDADLRDVNEIVFNLHFRKRTNEGNKQWVTDDTLGWNNYSITNNNGVAKLTPISGLIDSDADLLTYLDFTDADVYYQRNILKKSFIRLSVYDTSGRTNQSLYNYSTIFYDSGDAFSKYLKARALSEREAYEGITDEDIYYVSDEHEDMKDIRLSASFKVKSKYSSEGSSDGYYLYLFPSVVEGYNTREMYMKVEFNHSKYGRVVPFTLPTDTNGNTVLTTNSDIFPIHYMETSGSTYTNVNYQRLMKDMYFKIRVKYDSVKNRYVWMLPDNSDNVIDKETGTMIINLFEPRVNGYEVLKSDTEYEKAATNIGEDCYITVSTEIIDPTGKNFDDILRYTLLFNGITVFNSIGISNASDNTTRTSSTFKITGNHACIIIDITNTSLSIGHTAVLKRVGDETELASVEIGPSATEIMEYGFTISDVITKDGNNKNCLKLVIEWR